LIRPSGPHQQSPHRNLELINQSERSRELSDTGVHKAKESLPGQVGVEGGRGGGSESHTKRIEVLIIPFRG